jgi:hypothetical protein
MDPGEDVIWKVELPDKAPALERLNPVCEPMVEG